MKIELLMFLLTYRYFKIWNVFLKIFNHILLFKDKKNEMIITNNCKMWPKKPFFTITTEETNYQTTTPFSSMFLKSWVAFKSGYSQCRFLHLQSSENQLMAIFVRDFLHTNRLKASALTRKKTTLCESRMLLDLTGKGTHFTLKLNPSHFSMTPRKTSSFMIYIIFFTVNHANIPT